MQMWDISILRSQLRDSVPFDIQSSEIYPCHGFPLCKRRRTKWKVRRCDIAVVSTCANVVTCFAFTSWCGAYDEHAAQLVRDFVLRTVTKSKALKSTCWIQLTYRHAQGKAQLRLWDSYILRQTTNLSINCVTYWNRKMYHYSTFSFWKKKGLSAALSLTPQCSGDMAILTWILACSNTHTLCHIANEDLVTCGLNVAKQANLSKISGMQGPIL